MVEPQEEPAASVREQTQKALYGGALYLAAYLRDVMHTTLRLLKGPLGIVAFIVALSFACSYAIERLADMLTPLCLIPGISASTSLCARYTLLGPDVDKAPKSTALSKLVELHGNFEGLVNTNTDTNQMSLKLKQAEIATRDLVMLVRVSDLRSRDILAETLLRFVEDAKRAGEGLHRLSARIDGAVDRITAVNDYAMRTIAGAITRHNSPLQIVYDMISRSGEESNVEDVAVRSYGDVVETLARESHRALLEASTSAARLEQLQEHLLTIHEICLREGLSLGEAHAELLSKLWTILGGNRHSRRKAETNLAILKEVDWYRKQALAHVVVTRNVLQAMTADVEELRDRSAAPQIVGGRIPAEVLIRSIGHGVERLKESRRRASEEQRVLINDLLAASIDRLGAEGS